MSVRWHKLVDYGPGCGEVDEPEGEDGGDLHVAENEREVEQISKHWQKTRYLDEQLVC